MVIVSNVTIGVEYKKLTVSTNYPSHSSLVLYKDVSFLPLSDIR